MSRMPKYCVFERRYLVKKISEREGFELVLKEVSVLLYLNQGIV